jgi:hypothetical protein
MGWIVTVDGLLLSVLQVGALLLAIAVSVAPVVILVVLAQRHLNGRKSRLDGLFGGIGRANAMNSHLRAGTPGPDDLAVPLPPRPDGLGWRRRRRSSR